MIIIILALLTGLFILCIATGVINLGTSKEEKEIIISEENILEVKEYSSEYVEKVLSGNKKKGAIAESNKKPDIEVKVTPKRVRKPIVKKEEEKK